MEYLTIFTIKNGEYSAYLPPSAFDNANSPPDYVTGKITDLKIVEKDDNHTILVEFTIPPAKNYYRNRKVHFEIMPGGKTRLTISIYRGSETVYEGKIGPI